MQYASLEERLAEIDKRLTTIEQRLHIQHRIETVPKKVPLAPATVSNKPEASSGNLLGFIAILCFILAAAFIVKLSIQTGWLTPERQVAISYLLGISLIIVGFRFLSIDKKYLSLLPAAGIIILYLTTFAAKQLYFIVSFETSIAITSIVSLLALGFYLKIKHDLYAVVAAVGAYVSPIFLGSTAENIFSLYYFLICSLTFAFMSIYTKSRTLSIVGSYFAILMTALIGLSLNQDALIVFLLVGQFLIYSIAMFTYSIYTGKSLTEKEAWSFFPVLMIFYAAEYYFIDKINPNLAPWISLGLAGFLLILYMWGKSRFTNVVLASEAMIVGFISIILFHSGYLELMPDSAKPWTFALIIIALTFFTSNFYVLKATNKNFQIIPTVAIGIILVNEYSKMLLHFQDYDLNWYLATIVASASIWILFIMRVGKNEKTKTEIGYLILCAAHVLAITAFYELTHDISSLAVSVAWLIYGCFVIIVGFIRRDKIMANSALIVLGIATVKVFLYDVAAAPTIVRILCLLSTGIVLYGSGFLMRKISQWD